MMRLSNDNESGLLNKASSPICESAVVDLVDLVMSRDHQNDNAVWLCRVTKEKKKKLKATKGPAQSAFEPTTIRGSKVSRLYRPGYIGIDDCVVKNNPWNHGHRQGVLDSRSGKSVWCAFDKT